MSALDHPDAGPLPPVVRPATAADLGALAALLQRPVALPDAAHEQLLVAVPGGGAAAAPLATLRLRPAIGLERPRVSYHVGCTVHAARELGLFHRQRTLLLGHDHTGASELADIAWAGDALPLAEQAAALRLLVQAALLRIAMQRDGFAATLIAELPGPRDGAGQSPFWHGLGRHFYAGDPQAAARQHGPDWRSLVAALLPRQPVYASFLPPAAAAAIAQVAAEARLLAEVLEAAGLRYGHHVNVEDGGPVLEARVDDLPGVAEARCWRAVAGAAGASGTGQPAWLLARADGGRLLRARAVAEGGSLVLEPAALAALALPPGADLWALPLGGAALRA